MSGSGAIDFLVVGWVERMLIHPIQNIVIPKLQHSHGSKTLKKRKHEDLLEDGTLGKFEKRRDAGTKRGHKDGSIPHFLKEQSDQRAGAKLQEPTEFDAQIRDAMQNCPDPVRCTAQKELERKARQRVTKVSERHEEMIKPVSKKMKKKFKMYDKKEKQIEKKAWCQQMSFKSMQQNDKFLNLGVTRWMAPYAEDRGTIREFYGGTRTSVWSDEVQFLATLKGNMVWCVENTDVFLSGFTGGTFQKALKKESALFAAVLFGGYVVDPTWLKKATEVFKVNGCVVEPHWRLKGAVRQPMELHVHESFKERPEFNRFAKLINAAQSDRWVMNKKDMANGSLLSHWTIRDSRKELRQPKNGFVLYESKEKAKEYKAKVDAKQAAVKKLEKKVKELKAKVPKPLSLGAMALQLKNAKAHGMKGASVGPEQFFEKISRMVQLRKAG